MGVGDTRRVTPSSAKRHHHVPQFYLRGFADGDRITTVELPGKRRYLQSVRRTAAENDFYSIPDHPDGSDAFEKVLGSLESDAARVFAAIHAGEWPLSSEARWVLAEFIAVQVSRGPEQRRDMDRLAAYVTRLEIGHGGRANVNAWAQRQLGAELTSGEAELLWEQATQPAGPEIRHSARAHIQQMLQVSEQVHRIVSARPWALVRFSRRSLITCDRPVALIPRESDEPWMGVGFMTAEGSVFPLTRRLALVMGDADPLMDRGVLAAEVREGAFDGEIEGTTRFEKALNAATASNASLYLYHHPDDAHFVPSDLPQPRPVSIELSGSHQPFSGEPTFGGEEAL